MQSDRFNGTEFADLSSSDLHQTAGRAGRRGKTKLVFVFNAPWTLPESSPYKQTFFYPPGPD